MAKNSGYKDDRQLSIDFECRDIKTTKIDSPESVAAGVIDLQPIVQAKRLRARKEAVRRILDFAEKLPQ